MRIRLFGGLELLDPAGVPRRLSTRKTSLLLAALVLSAQHGIRKETASQVFWPDRAETQARGSLRQALAAIRRAFARDGEGAIDVEGDLDTLHLIARPEQIDVWKFDRLRHAGDPASLTEAAGLYGGDVLLEVALPEGVDRWFAPYQRSYHVQALTLVETLSELPAGELLKAAPQCAALAERLLASDPAAEEAHRALIRIHLFHGRTNAAIRQLELCREALRRELNVEPEARTIDLLACGDAPISRPQPEKVAQTPIPAAQPAAPPPRRDQPSVIVMPFDNLSGNADEYFVDGVVEEITAALSRVREFFVIARQSAFAYKGRFVDVREVGRELGVEYVVEGTVRRGGDRLRISVQLVDAASRMQLWSDRYDGETASIFEFQEQIAAQVAGAISPAIRNAEIEIAKRRPTSSLVAYDLVLRAYPNLWSHDAAKNRLAISLLEEAVEMDPGYGRAHALLAWCHSQEVVYLWSADPESDRRSASIAIETATGLIRDDPTALTAVGAAVSQCLENQSRATLYIESALALDPNSAWAWARYGWIALYRDEADAAIERFERSLALSPFDPLEFNLKIGIAMAFGLRGDYARGAAAVRDVLNRQPGVTWAYRQLAALSALAGDMPAAKKAVEHLLRAHPRASIAALRTSHPMRHLPRVFDLMVDAWRRAGLPET